ncbi:MAG: hypothetical protein COB20_01540 [SAR86 cluster bacterium]|uniref:Flagellar hook-length control protein-like C-terminal domain-containing protein n=1 Tax=SAR86 cluster bacterium TaxID=2030880 RepID=A0A2A4XH95_9GAMM|nr:MAG: hypothetical protein COB20_01540 [SAR86 cluster bacterium]
MPNAARIGSQSADWKLGQITQGRVANSNRANPSINIAGTNYQVASNLQFSQGESLLLKVSGVSPQLEFSIISRARRNVGNSDVASVILPDKFLHNSPAANRNINSSLTNLISLLHASSSSPVPSATALLIDSMRSRIVREGGLTNPKLIENSLLSNSLLMSSPSDSKALGGGLLDLLKQIASSLENQRNSAGRIPAGMKYQQALGMSLYLSGDINFLGTFTREVEEQFANLLNLRNRTQEDMQQHAYRLLAELPVLFRNQVKSISIRYLGKKSGGKREFDGTGCGVDFEFEFSNGKIYTRILITGSSVRLSVGCEKISTAEYLNTSKNSLEERLSNYGLNLKGFTAVVHDGYLSLDTDAPDTKNLHEAEQMKNIVSPTSTERTDEATRIELRNVYTEGKIPKLEEFALQINNQDVEVTSEIPAQLYCAMACFFAQLFEEK